MEACVANNVGNWRQVSGLAIDNFKQVCRKAIVVNSNRRVGRKMPTPDMWEGECDEFKQARCKWNERLQTSVLEVK